MMNPKTTADVNKLNLAQVLEYMQTKSAEEIAAFKDYANSNLKDQFGNDRKPGFLEVRNWVVNKYFPNIEHVTKKPSTKMLDRIMAI